MNVHKETQGRNNNGVQNRLWDLRNANHFIASESRQTVNHFKISGCSSQFRFTNNYDTYNTSSVYNR